MVPGPDPFHYLSPPDLSSGPQYISSLSSGRKYQDRNPPANLFPTQGEWKKKGEKKYALLAKRPKQFATSFHEGDYTTGFTETMGLSTKVSEGQDRFTTKHTFNDIARESGPGLRKNLGGGHRHCERGECRGNGPRRVSAGKQRNRRRQRRKNMKQTNKRQMQRDEEEAEGVRLEDMMDIRELQEQQQNREHGREMVDYPPSLRQTALSSSSSLGSPSPSSLSSSGAEQLELPFLSSYPRASTIEQLIGDPLDGWDIHMPNSEFFEDNE